MDSFILLAVLCGTVVSAQQCTTSLDCRSIEAPHCSRWGWCQWTPQFGENGPDQDASQRSFSIEEMSDETIENLYKITDYAGEYSGSEIYDYYSYDILKKKPDSGDSKLDSSIFGGDIQLVTFQPPVQSTPDPTIGKALDFGRIQEELPEEGETKGCLYDCVSDCVPIKKLEAYTQCVHFCGSRCQ